MNASQQQQTADSIELHRQSVSKALAETGARLERAGAVTRGLSLAEWSNCDNHARYHRPGHHTFSLYLAGGDKVLREDKNVFGGAPDKLCLLPAGHESRWHIGGPLRMLHLYIEPEILAHRAMSAYDIDPRLVDLRDLTFFDDPVMAMIVRGGLMPLDWTEKGDRMALDSACQLLIHHLLKRYSGNTKPSLLRGGLAPTVRRRIVDYIDANLTEAMTLDHLADQAGLSTFHFAKMFRISFGMPPHRYLADRRIAKAQALLSTGKTSLAQVASACGYASQSHFTRAFKASVGQTPGAWRK